MTVRRRDRCEVGKRLFVGNVYFREELLLGYENVNNWRVGVTIWDRNRFFQPEENYFQFKFEFENKLFRGIP